MRGSLLIWLDKEMAWLAPPDGSPGRPSVFSDAAIQFCLTTSEPEALLRGIGEQDGSIAAIGLEVGPLSQRLHCGMTEAGLNVVLMENRLPELSPDAAGVVIFGERLSAADEASYPYLTAEMAWIEEVMAAGLPTLGICLGAQMIIRILGGQVGPLNGNLHEFGYYPVSPTPEGRDFLPDTQHVTEAHFHTFTLPEGVTLLASGANHANQAFRYGDKVFGVKFHPECTAQIFRRWQQSNMPPSANPARKAVRSRTG